MSLPVAITKSKDIVNVRKAVNQDFSSHLTYNLFTHEPEYDGHPLHDDDLHNVRHDLCAKYEFEASTENVLASVIHVAKLKSYHPVKDFIETVKWDNVPRVDNFFINYFKCEDQPELYLRTVSKYFFIGAVARIYEPGCKLDTMPVIQSDQGWYKSSTLKQLFGGFFTDQMGTIQQKDDLIKMTKAWGIEFSELTAFKRSDKNQQKQFLTMTDDVIRLPYDKLAKRYPRQCVLVGTTNDDEYLTDSENRRFMPVTLKGVDRELLKTDIHQLWAEALCRYQQGEPWWHEREDTEMVELFDEQTKERKILGGNGAMFKVKEWLEETQKEFYTNEHIETAIGDYNSPLYQSKSYDVRQVLKDLGFKTERHYVEVDGDFKQKRGYFRKLKAPATTPKSADHRFDALLKIFEEEQR